MQQGALLTTAIKKSFRRFTRINDFSSTDMINEIDLVKTIDVQRHRLFKYYGFVWTCDCRRLSWYSRD